MVEFSVQNGNVVEVSSDLLLLKHAQAFYGADLAVANILLANYLCKESELQVLPGESIVIETKNSIPAKIVMFLGTPSLYNFRYMEMQEFAKLAIKKIYEKKMPVKTLTTTVHGSGYGLDGGESLQRLVKGFTDGLSLYAVPIERIIFLTLGERAERMLSSVLSQMAINQREMKLQKISQELLRNDISEDEIKPPSESVDIKRNEEVTVQVKTEKGKAFVAMPFSEDFLNVYEFAIYPAIHDCGLICERVDETHFTGDILNRIKNGIESAKFVIADLTEGRPNVYLEVGYAWGKNIPVIIVAKKGETLAFDVKTHRCIFYGSFTQFRKELKILIQGLLSSGEI